MRGKKERRRGRKSAWPRAANGNGGIRAGTLIRAGVPFVCGGGPDLRSWWGEGWGAGQVCVAAGEAQVPRDPTHARTHARNWLKGAGGGGDAVSPLDPPCSPRFPLLPPGSPPALSRWRPAEADPGPQVCRSPACDRIWAATHPGRSGGAWVRRGTGSMTQWRGSTPRAACAQARVATPVTKKTNRRAP